MLYDSSTGGCRDGLHPDRVNDNQGAESTLAFLMALLEMRLREDADLPFMKHEALVVSTASQSPKISLEIS